MPSRQFGGSEAHVYTVAALVWIVILQTLIPTAGTGSYDYLPYSSITIDANGETGLDAASLAEVATAIVEGERSSQNGNDDDNEQGHNNDNNNNNQKQSRSSSSSKDNSKKDAEVLPTYRFHSRLGGRGSFKRSTSTSALSLLEEDGDPTPLPDQHRDNPDDAGQTTAERDGKPSPKPSKATDQSREESEGGRSSSGSSTDSSDQHTSSSRQENSDEGSKQNEDSKSESEEQKSPRDNRDHHHHRSHGEIEEDEGSESPGHGVCAGHAKDIGGGSEGHFRLYGRPARMFRVGDHLAMYRNADCTDKEEDMLVTATPMISRDDVFKDSWASLNIAVGLAELSRQKRYLCGPKEGRQDSLQCIAEVGWPMMRFNPSQLLKPFVSYSNSSSPLKYYVRRASAMDDWVLDLYEYMIFVTAIIGVISVFHAIYVFFTLAPSDDMLPLKGIKTIPIHVRIFFGALQMMTFGFGVNSMVTLSTRIFLADAPVWMIQSILGSGALLALLGTLRLSQLLFTSQLYEVALLQGKYIVPDAVSFFVGVGDIVVIAAFICCGGLIFFCWCELQSSPEEISGCISGVLAIVKILHGSIEGQKRQQDGLCSVALQPLAAASVTSKVSRTTSKDEVDLMHHFEEHPNVEIHIGHLCHGVRRGKDPLNELDDADYEEPQDWDRMWGYNVLDIRWHARYIHKKSGSKVTVVSLPLCCCFILMVLTQCAGQRFRVEIARPTLTTLEPSEGVLIPPFDPEIKEYTLLHDANIDAFSFLNLADTQASRSKEFRLSGTEVGNVSAGNPLVAVDTKTQISQNQYPYDMLIRVLGATKDGTPNREETYSISFSKVSRILVTMKLTATNWSRCVYWGPIRSTVMALPPETTSVNVEVGTLEYAEGVPISLRAWRRVARRQTSDSALISRPTAVFEALPNSTRMSCKDRCSAEVGCMMTHVSAHGCFHIMLKVTNESCSKLHDMDLVEKVPQSIARLTSRTEVVASLCPRSTTKWTKCAMQSSLGDTDERSQRMTFPQVNLTEARYNSFTLVMGLKRVDSDSAQPYLERKLGFWKGAPIPEHILVAPQQGLDFTYTKNPDKSVIIKFDRYKVADWGKTFKVLLIPLVEDLDFILKSPRRGQIWNGKQLDPPLDFGRCETLADTFQTLWACSHHNHGHNHHPSRNGSAGRDRHGPGEGLLQSDGILVTIDPLQPSKTKVSLELVPRSEALLPIFGTESFHVSFSTMDEKSPAAWSVKDSCGIFAPDKNAEYIASLLTNDVILSALPSCDNVTLEFEESRVVLPLVQWIGMALRRAPEEGTLIQLIQALIESKTPVLPEILSSDVHGIFTVENEQCVPYLGTAWDEVRVQWDTVIKHSTNLKTMLCDFGKGRIAPRYAASLIRGWTYSDQSLLRLLDCIGLPSPTPFGFQGPLLPGGFDWHSVQTSPVAAAIRAHNDKALASLLDRYSAIFASVEVVGTDAAHTRSLLEPTELAALYGCTSCVPKIVEAVGAMRKTCEDDPASIGGPACEDFLDNVLSLNLGAVDLTEESDIADVVATIEALSASINFERLDLRETLPDRSRLMQLYPIWKRLTQLKVLDLSDNGLDSCEDWRPGTRLLGLAGGQPAAPEEPVCTWTNMANVRAIISDDDPKASFPDLKAATRVCTKLGQAFCGQILCQDGQAGCTIHKNSGHSTDPNGRVGTSHTPSKGCFEEQIYDFLSVLTNLQDLRLRGNELCTLGLAQIANSLASMRSLEILDLSSTRIEGVPQDLLTVTGSLLPQIKSLNISFNELGVSGVLALLPEPTQGGGSTFISLSASHVGIANADQSFSFFMKHLADYKGLEVLELGNNALSSGIDDLLGALLQLKNLRRLDLGNVGLDGSTLRKLKLASDAKGLEALLLGGNNLGDGAIEVIASQLLKTGRPVLDLDLSHTGLTSDGGTSLQRKISEKSLFSKLHTIRLCGNSLTDDSLKSLIYSAAVTKNANVSNWYVSDTLGVWPKNATKKWETLRALERRLLIKVFDFSGNQAPLSHIRSSLPDDHTVRELYLRGSIISDIEEYDFIGNLPHLEILDVSDNHLSRSAVQRLLMHAAKAVRLKELVLYGNNFSREDLEQPTGAEWFQALNVLKGDFTPCDMQALRLHFPRTEIVGRREHIAPRRLE